jgi:hypothetical protein
MTTDDGPRPGDCAARVERAGVPGWCRQKAGAGTDHFGAGRCLHHCGSTPTGRQAGALKLFERDFAGRVRFGDVVETDPLVGLLTEVSRSAGFVSYVEAEIHRAGGTTPEEGVRLTESTAGGDQRVSVLVSLWVHAREHLAKVCKLALDADVEQSRLDLIVSYRERVVTLLEGVLMDLGLDPDDPRVDQVVMRRLSLAGANAIMPPAFVSPFDRGRE